MKIGRFTMDTEKRRLMLEREDMQLGSRAFDILLAIVTAGGRLVKRRELLKIVWKGVIVSESNLDVHLCRIRKKLGTDRDLIITVPRQGYRLASPLSTEEVVNEGLEGDEHIARPAGREETIALLREVLYRLAPESLDTSAGSTRSVPDLQHLTVRRRRNAMLRNRRVLLSAERAIRPISAAPGGLRCARANQMRQLRQQ